MLESGRDAELNRMDVAKAGAALFDLYTLGSALKKGGCARRFLMECATVMKKRVSTACIWFKTHGP